MDWWGGIISPYVAPQTSHFHMLADRWKNLKGEPIRVCRLFVGYIVLDMERLQETWAHRWFEASGPQACPRPKKRTGLPMGMVRGQRSGTQQKRQPRVSKLNLHLEQEARAVMLGEGADWAGRGGDAPLTQHLLGCSPLRPHPPRPSEGLARVPISMNYLWGGQPNG